MRRLWVLIAHIPDGWWRSNWGEASEGGVAPKSGVIRVTDLDDLDRIFGGISD